MKRIATLHKTLHHFRPLNPYFMLHHILHHYIYDNSEIILSAVISNSVNRFLGIYGFCDLRELVSRLCESVWPPFASSSVDLRRLARPFGQGFTSTKTPNPPTQGSKKSEVQHAPAVFLRGKSAQNGGVCFVLLDSMFVRFLHLHYAPH